MSRDYRALRVFALADELVPAIYHATRHFPREEQYGLQSQMRRAAVSVPTNIVEGSARRTRAEYVSFLNVAHGSAAEVRYLVDLTRRLRYLTESIASDLDSRYTTLLKSLNVFISKVAKNEGSEERD